MKPEEHPMSVLKSRKKSDDEDSDSCDVGMMGGLTDQDLTASAWDNESVSSPIGALDTPENENTTMMRRLIVPKSPPPCRVIMSHPSPAAREIFACAYITLGNGEPHEFIQHPKVNIVDTGTVRGNALVATAPIAQGDVIFTEAALAAAQGATGIVAACQQCHRSLANIEDCLNISRKNMSSLLPCPQLWPIPKLHFDDACPRAGGSESSTDHHRQDQYGRVQCTSCAVLFCSTHCAARFQFELGPCCRWAGILSAIAQVAESNELESMPSSAVILALRLFVAAAERHRCVPSDGDNILDPSFYGLCGHASDVHTLELGVHLGNGVFTLCPYYNILVQELELTDQEQSSAFSLQLLHLLAAQVARNGVGIRTTSPFQQYLGALIRHAGGRGSAQHEILMRQVAHALTGQETLQRGLDRQVDERVAPQVGAIFALTARINHDCRPNARIQSAFCDARIDVVAQRDIVPNEEITICYVASSRNGPRRRQELRAKYLFTCQCTLCSTER